jgi:hypothetical protein
VGHEECAGRRDTRRQLLESVSNQLLPARDGGARFIPVLLEQHPDILIATTRGDCYRNAGGRVLHTVERQGVTLLYVFDLRAKSRS